MWSAIRYRRGQALVLVALSAVITACAVLVPLYDRAMRQALTRQTVDAAASGDTTVEIRSVSRYAYDQTPDYRPAAHDEVLAAVGLAEHAHTPLSELTAGRLQLAAVAVALASRPGLLLADEPTSQLDHAARDTVLAAIARANQEFGTTVLLVTHDPAVARSLPRTVTIRDGKIGGEGRLGEEYAVVTADGFLPLPAHALPSLPPGTLVRVRSVPEGFLLVVEDGGPP